MDESQEARAALQGWLSGVVRNWLHLHPRWETVRLKNSEEDYLAPPLNGFGGWLFTLKKEHSVHRLWYYSTYMRA
jgi:hypothetical protein